MLEFRAFIARINVLAEAQPGFLWRLKDDEDTAHQYFVKSRRKRFERMRQPYFVM